MTLALLGLLLVTPALAQSAPDPAKLALGFELYDLTLIAAGTESVAKSLPAQLPGAGGRGAALSPGERQGVSEITRQMAPITREAYAKAYAGHFSLAELQGLIGFYKSPLGVRFASQQAAITTEVMRTTFPQMMARTMAQASAPKK